MHYTPVSDSCQLTLLSTYGKLFAINKEGLP